MTDPTLTLKCSFIRAFLLAKKNGGLIDNETFKRLYRILFRRTVGIEQGITNIEGRYSIIIMFK